MSGWSTIPIGAGLPPFSIYNNAPNKFGNSSDALSLSSLLAELVTISQNFQVGGSGEQRTKEQLWDLAATASIYIPTLLNHDVTLGHHINGRTGQADPAPIIELYVNGVLAQQGGPGVGMRYGLSDGSCDTVGFIGYDINGTGTPAGPITLRVIYGDPYWNVGGDPADPKSVPVVIITPRGEDGLGGVHFDAANVYNGTNPGYVVSEITHFDLVLDGTALAGNPINLWFSYTVIGSRVAEIP